MAFKFQHKENSLFLWIVFLNCYQEYTELIYFFIYSSHNNMFQLRVLDHDIYILCHVYCLYSMQFFRNFASCKVICMHQSETCLTKCRGYLNYQISTKSVSSREEMCGQAQLLQYVFIHCAKVHTKIGMFD